MKPFKVDVAMTEFSPAPSPPQKFMDLFALVGPAGTAWRYTACEHHAHEMVMLEYAAGGHYNWWLYWRPQETNPFCPVCWHFAQVRDRERPAHSHPPMLNQVAAVKYQGGKSGLYRG